MFFGDGMVVFVFFFFLGFSGYSYGGGGKIGRRGGEERGSIFWKLE